MEQSHYLRNEFAMVEVTISTSGGNQMLRIRNADTNDEIVLYPLELEALTRMDHRAFGSLILSDGSGG